MDMAGEIMNVCGADIFVILENGENSFSVDLVLHVEKKNLYML